MVFDKQAVVDNIPQQVGPDRHTGPRRLCPTRLTMTSTAIRCGSPGLTSIRWPAIARRRFTLRETS